MANAGKIGGLLGLMAGGEALLPEDVEALPAVKGFAQAYEKAVLEGSKKKLYAGTLEPNVFEQALRRDPAVRNNKVFVGTHAGDVRSAIGEMQPIDVGRYIEDMLNSAATRVMPNFPSENAKNNARAMFFSNIDLPVVAPFSAGKYGDISLRTVFEPKDEKRKFIEGYLGGPIVPSISAYRGNPLPVHSSREKISVVRQPSGETMPNLADNSKNKLPAIAGTATGLGFAHGLPQEPGVQSTNIEFDLALAPVGVVGRVPKALAVTSAFLGNGLLGMFTEDDLIDGLLGMFKDGDL